MLENLSQVKTLTVIEEVNNSEHETTVGERQSTHNIENVHLEMNITISDHISQVDDEIGGNNTEPLRDPFSIGGDNEKSCQIECIMRVYT